MVKRSLFLFCFVFSTLFPFPCLGAKFAIRQPSLVCQNQTGRGSAPFVHSLPYVGTVVALCSAVKSGIAWLFGNENKKRTEKPNNKKPNFSFESQPIVSDFIITCDNELSGVGQKNKEKNSCKQRAYQEVCELSQDDDDVVFLYNERLERRKEAIKKVLQAHGAQSVYHSQISPKTRSFLELHSDDIALYESCTGNALQYVLHKEFVEVVQEVADIENIELSDA